MQTNSERVKQKISYRDVQAASASGINSRARRRRISATSSHFFGDHSGITPRGVRDVPLPAGCRSHSLLLSGGTHLQRSLPQSTTRTKVPRSRLSNCLPSHFPLRPSSLTSTPRSRSIWTSNHAAAGFKSRPARVILPQLDRYNSPARRAAKSNPIRFARTKIT